MQPVLQAPPGLGGWQLDSGLLTDWSPRFLNPSAHISQVYVDGTKKVELYIGYYRNQRQSAELIASQNVLVHSGDKIWGSISEVHRVLNVNNNEIRLIETKLRGQDTRLVVWHWYWIDGQYTANPYWAKLLQAKSQVLGRGDDAAVIIVSTQFGLNAGEGTDRLRDFVNAMLPTVAKVLQGAR